jgi:hypothetical protein
VAGVNLYVARNYSLAETKAWGERDLKYIADTLKLKAVAVEYGCSTPSGTQIRAACQSGRGT